jgi:hypothetical protein
MIPVQVVGPRFSFPSSRLGTRGIFWWAAPTLIGFRNL